MSAAANAPQAPIARQDAGTDPYAWLQARDTPEVLAYLNAENAYQEAQLADQAALRCEQADLMGTRLHLVAGTLKAVGSALSTVFDRVLHHSRQHLRTTEGLDKVQADQLVCQASQLLELHGEHTLINGEKLVKARGAQIHFG